MSAKNYDNHNRWRNRTVAFRVSAEEDLQLETFVRITGLTKQDYITRRLLCKDVVVQGNPRVFKALRDQFVAVLDELQRIEAGASVDDELLDTIQMMAAIMDGMKEDSAYGALRRFKSSNPDKKQTVRFGWSFFCHDKYIDKKGLLVYNAIEVGSGFLICK